MVKISVIIPYYNSSTTIERCINSILNQNVNNYEILIVNDGSRQEELKILKQYEKNKSITIINKQNSGVSDTRNIGIENSTGDYVFFIDADDYIELNTFSKLNEILNKYIDIEIIKFGFKKKYGNIVKENFFRTKNEIIINKKEYHNEIYKNITTTDDFFNIWNMIIKKDIIKDLKFNTKLKYSEDYLFMVQALINSNNIYFMNDKLYNYCVSKTSVTQIVSRENILKKLDDIAYTTNQIKIELNNKSFHDDSIIYQNFYKLLIAEMRNIAANYSYNDYVKTFYKITELENIKKIIIDNKVKEIILNKKNYLKFRIKKKINKILKRIIT